jgi:hypothetical protein
LPVRSHRQSTFACFELQLCARDLLVAHNCDDLTLIRHRTIAAAKQSRQ